LKFYRGYWCPYCVGELDQLNRYAKDFAALGVTLVALSSDRVDELQAFRRKHDWAITLLADPALDVHRLYNVQQRNFTPRRGPFRDLAIPSTILIDRDGRVLLIEQSVNFRVRPQADRILAKTKALVTESALESAAAASCDVCAA
jgi:peroxiredoxin